jgi:16S rRNA (guanine1516-N2)-methyltransferase
LFSGDHCVAGAQPLAQRVVVAADGAALSGAAASLAQELGLRFVSRQASNEVPSTAAYLLVVGVDRLQIQWLSRTAHVPSPFCVDFVSGRMGYRTRAGAAQHELLVRAVGGKPGDRPCVVDATGGFGRDALLLASVGCEVHLIERNPVVGALLADGLCRLAAHDGAVARLLTLTRGEAAAVLQTLSKSGAIPDVVYLDPMFPATGNSAAAKKEQQLLRDLAVELPQEEALFAAAWACAAKRVVVKRPRLGPAIAGQAPSFSLRGGSARFDVYCRT